MSFEVLLDIMEFALNNAIVKMPEGKLLRQTKGIPMGDPLSLAMTIGACAWMEGEWMQQLDGNTKGKFVAKRYMDDILVAYAENQTWDHMSDFVGIGLMNTAQRQHREAVIHHTRTRVRPADRRWRIPFTHCVLHRFGAAPNQSQKTDASSDMFDHEHSPNLKQTFLAD